MTGQSENLNELAKSLAAAQGEFPNIDGDQLGQVGSNRKYKYASLAHIIEQIRPVMAKHGLCVLQTSEPGEENAIRLVTTLLHESGQYVASTIVMPLVNATPQGYGSAMTYARRYAYAAILGLAADTDDDGHEGSQQQAQPAARSQAGRQQAQPPKPPAPGNGSSAQPPPTEAQRIEAVSYDAADQAAIAYLGQKLKPKGYSSTGDVLREMKAAGLSPKALIGVLIKTLPDLTGGGEPPANGSSDTPYEPSAADCEFYGSREKAIEAHQRAQQPATAGAN